MSYPVFLRYDIDERQACRQVFRFGGAKYV